MVTDLSSDILYFYINAMLELHSYIAHMWLRDIPEQVSYSWKLNLSVTKYKISLKQKCISINNEVNVTHCYFAKWQLIHCNQRGGGGTVKRKHTGNTASQKQRGCAGEAISWTLQPRVPPQSTMWTTTLGI